MQAVAGPAWFCVECAQDSDLPEDDYRLTHLTIYDGCMVCLYHFKGFVEKLRLKAAAERLVRKRK